MSDPERLAISDAQFPPVTPTYCRHPDCRAVLSVPHPLADGWIHDVVCSRHKDATASRYSDNSWASGQAAYAPVPERCASCRSPISSRAEWCCEPCATGDGHSDACSADRRPRLYVLKGGDPS